MNLLAVAFIVLAVGTIWMLARRAQSRPLGPPTPKGDCPGGQHLWAIPAANYLKATTSTYRVCIRPGCTATRGNREDHLDDITVREGDAMLLCIRPGCHGVVGVDSEGRYRCARCGRGIESAWGDPDNETGVTRYRKGET
jgi:hypothetical protein